MRATPPAESSLPSGPGLHLANVTVSFPQPRGQFQTVLDIGQFDIAPGASCGIAGPSGSGKTTLLHVLCGLLTPERGIVQWGADDFASLGESERDAWRRRNLGLVFQDFHLVPELSALANVLLPFSFGTPRPPVGIAARAREMLRELGIAEPDRRAALLSRGEQQRVAIIRALLPRPRVLIADEPTASLDRANADVIAALLSEQALALGATFIAVSHDPVLLGRMDQTWRIESGHLAPAQAGA